MTDAGWLQFGAMLAVNLIIVAYIFGGMRAEIKALKDRVDALTQTQAHAENELFRGLYAVARGERIPSKNGDFPQ